VTLEAGDRVMDEATSVYYAVATVEKFFGRYRAHHLECVLEEIGIAT
jgi:hypothetical protein